MKTRTRFLAIAAATAAAVTALSGCAGASAEEMAETTAYGFMRAALHISEANVDDFLCTKGAYPAVEDNADSWEVSIDSTMQIEGGTWEVKATQTLTSENARPQYPVTLVVRSDGSCVESIVGVEAQSGGSEKPESTPTPEPEGASSNPLAISPDGGTVIDVSDFSRGEVSVTASANSSFAVAGSSALDAPDVSEGLNVETTPDGLLVTVLDDQEPQYLVVYGDDVNEFWIYIND